jgi:hypothetical protein
VLTGESNLVYVLGRFARRQIGEELAGSFTKRGRPERRWIQRDE